MVLALLSVSSFQARALQPLVASDGATLQGLISIQEPTRVRVEGAPITDVVGNLYSSHNCEAGSTGVAATAGPAGLTGTSAGALSTGATSAAMATVINPYGEIALECDRDKGEIYLRPVSASAPVGGRPPAAGSPGKPINLFISTARATYTLLLQRADRPADTIVIRDAALATIGNVPSRSRLDVPLGPAPSHIRSLKAMLVAMATDHVPTDIRIEEINKPIQLWAQSQFSLMRVYEGRGLIGERYQLTNVSAEPLVLADQEFDRETGDVVAVSIENHNLLPGGSTVVYVIRLGGLGGDASPGGVGRLGNEPGSQSRGRP